jgi:putative oxidoreductase
VRRRGRVDGRVVTGLADVRHGWSGLLIAVVLGLAGGIGQLLIFYRPPAKKSA